MRRASTSNAPRGFALLDLLVSVLILGLFLVPLAIARNNVILMAGQSVALRKARILAAQKIGELELENLDELVGSSGDFGEENPGFVWETRVEVLPLGEVVDLDPVLTEEEKAERAAQPEPEEVEGPEYEVVKLTLVVRNLPDESTIGLEEVPEDLADGEAVKIREPDRIVIVRFFLRETETEGTLTSGG